MPVVLTVGAVAVIAALIAIGIRHRWDPTPAPPPPSGMSVPARAPDPMRGHWPIAIAGVVALFGLGVLGAATGQRWLLVAGLLVYGLSWTYRSAATHLVVADRLRRVVAVVRPASLVLGFVLASALGSAWWFAAGAVVFLSTRPLLEAFERGRRGGSSSRSSVALPGEGDTPR